MRTRAPARTREHTPKARRRPRRHRRHREWTAVPLGGRLDKPHHPDGWFTR